MLRKPFVLASLGLALGLGAPAEAGAQGVIEFFGSTGASDATGPILIPPDGISPGSPAIRAFNNVDHGSLTATSHGGLASLAGVDPANITIRFGDLERTATTFDVGTATISYGDVDLSPNVFEILVNGGLAAVGSVAGFDLTMITAPGTPGVGTASGSGSVAFTGVGGDPLYLEIRALTGGSGSVGMEIDTFRAVAGSDPAGFVLRGRLLVPEPSTLWLVGLGLAGLAVRARKGSRPR